METLDEEPGECAEQAVDSARTLGKRRMRENERERGQEGKIRRKGGKRWKRRCVRCYILA